MNFHSLLLADCVTYEKEVNALCVNKLLYRLTGNSWMGGLMRCEIERAR